MVALLLALGLAGAASVQCDPIAASALLSDARVSENRVPLTHPELVPGLALAAPGTPADLRAALADLCEAPLASEAPRSSLPTVSQGPSFTGHGDGAASGTWTVQALAFTRTEQRGCSLFGRTVNVSVATEEGRSPRYSLLSRSPVTRTPLGDCPDAPRWREEYPLGEMRGSVQLLAVRDMDGDQVVHSSIRVRRATREGWTEQVIVEPAPPRMMAGTEGPLVELAGTEDPPWVVVHGGRRTQPGAESACVPEGGQEVWIPGLPGEPWVPHRGRDALALLAAARLWRYGGDDGWMLVLAAIPEDDRLQAERKAVRLQARLPQGERLYLLESAAFPDLNPGFWILVPAPWSTEDQARSALERWRRLPAGAYVKRAWSAPDPCGSP